MRYFRMRTSMKSNSIENMIKHSIFGKNSNSNKKITPLYTYPIWQKQMGSQNNMTKTPLSTILYPILNSKFYPTIAFRALRF
jgi:hypothetical protein